MGKSHPIKKGGEGVKNKRSRPPHGWGRYLMDGVDTSWMGRARPVWVGSARLLLAARAGQDAADTVTRYVLPRGGK